MDDKTEFEMVHRHVREGEEHVARQRELVASLPPWSDAARQGRRLLANFEDLQAQHVAHLARLLAAS